ncbi:LOW QUALITY PROTEIN: acyl-coenzyme A thioesterase 1 [Oreochromis niloticus]|uniref:LOW QUALITY PROTEIN: acyl-coenzyme A thioesterase 1 n=1 Tax=Oreochromis niloticus TaxID=8128 RepID=UPI000DF37279|nr:LOW QUALITY PROTEIN: acyl-coenzyme A thioesterase 1 [Oreochromis niloticus]
MFVICKSNTKLFFWNKKQKKETEEEGNLSDRPQPPAQRYRSLSQFFQRAKDLQPSSMGCFRGHFCLFLESLQVEKMSSQVRLKLLPRARCLFDEPIKVKVEGLRSRQVVTMRARLTDEKGVVFSSSATYRADGSGEVDLNRDPSLGGTYVGVEPMGLLWSMRPDTMHKRFQKTKSLEPQLVKFSVYEEEGRILAEETNERLLIGDGVSGSLSKRGTLVESCSHLQGLAHVDREGLFPAVLDMPTLRSETRASLLANKGFVVLSMRAAEAIFQNMQKIHLDHFKEAMDFLKQQPKVGSKGVGIVGRSKGADLALSLATFVPGVEAAVCINGNSANVGVPLYHKKQKILSPLMYDLSKLIPTESGASIGKYICEDPLAEKTRAASSPLNEQRLISSLWLERMTSGGTARPTWTRWWRLKRHGKENFESVSYRGAGHLLEPPYEPFCPSSAHGILRYLSSWGGQPKAHTAAEVQLWKKIQEFFRTHLSCDPAQTKAKL